MRGRVSVVVGSLCLVATACSSGSSGSNNVALNQPPPPATMPTPTPTLTLASNLTPITATLVTKDGERVRFDLELSPLMPGDDSAAINQAFDGSGTAPCETGPTDGVIAGTLTLTNETPNYPPNMKVVVDIPGGSSGLVTISLGIGYANDPSCAGLDGENYDDEEAYYNPAISPNFSGSQWGPVPIEFAVDNAYSPDYPSGDVSVVTQDDPLISGWVGDPAGQDAYLVRQLQGPASIFHGQIQVDFGNLGSTS